MDFKEHWRLRLIELMDAVSVTQATFAERTGISPDYLSRLLYPPGKNGRKSLGPVTIRKIGEAYGLPPGWFDQPAGSALGALSADQRQRVQITRVTSNEDFVGLELPAFLRKADDSQVPDNGWPFKRASRERIERVAREFAAHGRHHPIEEMDKILDVLLERWESQLDGEKSRAA